MVTRRDIMTLSTFDEVRAAKTERSRQQESYPDKRSTPGMYEEDEYEEDEMEDSEEESEEEHRECVKQSNRRIIRIGLLTEMLVAPAVETIIEDCFGQRPLQCLVIGNSVPRGWDLQDSRELDTFAHTETPFFIVSSPGGAEMPEAEALVASLPELHEFFPEIDQRELVPTFDAVHAARAKR